MIYILSNPFDVEKFRGWCERMIGRQATLECRQKHPPRSMAQNNYLHVILTYFASEFGYSTDEVKQDIFKRQVNASIFIHERINHIGLNIRRVRYKNIIFLCILAIAFIKKNIRITKNF